MDRNLHLFYTIFHNFYNLLYFRVYASPLGSMLGSPRISEILCWIQCKHFLEKPQWWNSNRNGWTIRENGLCCFPKEIRFVLLSLYYSLYFVCLNLGIVWRSASVATYLAKSKIRSNGHDFYQKLANLNNLLERLNCVLGFGPSCFLAFRIQRFSEIFKKMSRLRLLKILISLSLLIGDI